MKVTVIGLGSVGTVAAVSLAMCGLEVLATDVDPARVHSLCDGVYGGYEPGLADRLKDALRGGNLKFLHCDEVGEDLGEVAIITVGTPAGEGYAPDLSQVHAAISWVRERCDGSLVVAMKSTVPRVPVGEWLTSVWQAPASVTPPIPSSSERDRRLPTGTAQTALSSGLNPGTLVHLKRCATCTATPTPGCWPLTSPRPR